MFSRSRLFLAFAAAAALMAVIPATSSAAEFKWSATGSFASKALQPQVLTLASGPYGSVKCTSASGQGGLTSTDYSQFELTVSYSGCTAFGFQGVQTTAVKYRYHADGRFDVVTPLTVSVPFAACTLTIKPQANRTAVQYANNGGRIIFENAVGGIAYTTEGAGVGQLCPASGSNATLTGSNELERVGGGSVYWQP